MTFEGRILNNRYQIERLLSKGGMGMVYLGRHVLIGKKVAIKVLNPEWSVREDVVTRFFREAQITSVIGHRNVVDILDIGLIDKELPYLVMEYMEGENLADLLKREKHMNLTAACGVLEPLLLGLEAAHDAGVIHRDLKPDNIFLLLEKDGRTVTTKIIDFGISKFTNMIKELRLTMTGFAIGTPPYMSPEQARGDEEIDHRSDIYTTGVMFYEMVVGAMPFWGESVKEIKDKILHRAPIRPTKIMPNLSAAVEPIIAKAMNKNPDARYQRARDMLMDLRSLPEFPVREEALSHYVSRIERNRFVGSDNIGYQSPAKEGSPISSALSLFDSEPKEIEIETQTRPISLPISRRRRARLWPALPAALGISLAVWFYSQPHPSLPDTTRPVNGDTIQPAASSGPAAAPSKPEFVLIRLDGLPPNARITANGKSVTSPAFQWIKGSDPLSLHVTADGYAPYDTEFFPEANRVLVTELVPLRKKTSTQHTKATNSPTHTTAPEGASQKKKKTDAAKKSKYIKGSHGSKVSDVFE